MAARLAVITMLCTIPILLAVCSGFTADDECEPGEASVCESQCGPGTMHCLSDGSWGLCQPDTEPDCLPGDYGACELAEDAPPGLWFCSDDCREGPCTNLCIPGETYECEAQCGPGQTRCDDEGSWSECREYVLPPCRPGDVERCPDGVSYRRCGDDCWWGECEEGPCNPGEIARCGVCASQVCLANGTFTDCAGDAWAVCSPDQVEACEAPCGPGERRCTDRCEWTPCMELEPVPCHPGDRQVCPTTLYCGVAFRVCTLACDWGICLETGD